MQGQTPTDRSMSKHVKHRMNRMTECMVEPSSIDSTHAMVGPVGPRGYNWTRAKNNSIPCVG
eukprot:14675421-Heterocapsa_arctica.AAC.1